MQRMRVPQQLLQQVCISPKNFWEQVKAKGVNIAHVTLHVGLGTFRPVKVDDVEQHHMHSEFLHCGRRPGEADQRYQEKMAAV